MLDSFDLDNFDTNFEDFSPDNMLGSDLSIDIDGIGNPSAFDMSSLGGDSYSNGDTFEDQTFGLPNHHGLSGSEDHHVFHPDNNCQSDTHIDLSNIDGDKADNNISFKGYSKDEIQRHVSKAEKEIRYHEQQVSHHSYLANHNLGKADMESHLHEVKTHQREIEHWKSELQKWKWTKPDPEK